MKKQIISILALILALILLAACGNTAPVETEKPSDEPADVVDVLYGEAGGDKPGREAVYEMIQNRVVTDEETEEGKEEDEAEPMTKEEAIATACAEFKAKEWNGGLKVYGDHIVSIVPTGLLYCDCAFVSRTDTHGIFDDWPYNGYVIEAISSPSSVYARTEDGLAVEHYEYGVLTETFETTTEDGDHFLSWKLFELDPDWIYSTAIPTADAAYILNYKTGEMRRLTSDEVEEPEISEEEWRLVRYNQATRWELPEDAKAKIARVRAEVTDPDWDGSFRLLFDEDGSPFGEKVRDNGEVWVNNECVGHICLPDFIPTGFYNKNVFQLDKMEWPALFMAEGGKLFVYSLDDEAFEVELHEEGVAYNIVDAKVFYKGYSWSDGGKQRVFSVVLETERADGTLRIDLIRGNLDGVWSDFNDSLYDFKELFPYERGATVFQDVVMFVVEDNLIYFNHDDFYSYGDPPLMHVSDLK